MKMRGEKPVRNMLEHFRLLFGMPACTETDLMHCNHLKQEKVDGQYIHFCDKDKQCKEKK